MSKIFIVSATLRRNGNSEILASEFAKGAIESGHEVDMISLRDTQLNYCIGCMYCAKHGKCVLKDDINGLLDKVQNADVLVFATPIYYYGMAGQLKTFLDRMNPLFPKANRFKQVYLLTSAADDDNSAMDGAINGIEGWISCFSGVELAGVIYGIGANEAGDIKGTAAVLQAYNMGKSIR